MLICGASFAGLAVARELAGSGADVLVVDRYEIGERQTSACAIPTPWLEPMGIRRAVRQELEVHELPHAARDRAPSPAVDVVVVRLPHAVRGAVGAVRYCPICNRHGRGPRGGDTVRTDRGDLRRRWSSSARLAPRARPGRTSSRPRPDLPRPRGPPARRRGVDLDIWIDRSLIPTATPGRCPRRRAAGRRRLLRAARPRKGADARDRRPARHPPVRYQGNWFPHELRPAAEDGVFFVGDIGRTLHPAVGRRDPNRLLLRHRLRPGDPRRWSRARCAASALAAPTGTSRAPTAGVPWAFLLQRAIPALPPRLLGPPAGGMRPRPRSVPDRASLLVPEPGGPGASRAAAELNALMVQPPTHCRLDWLLAHRAETRPRPSPPGASNSSPTQPVLTFAGAPTNIAAPVESPSTSAASRPAWSRTGARARC